MDKLANKGDQSPAGSKISPAGGRPGQPGTDSRQESPTFATADPSASVSEMNDYVAIHGGIGGALVPPGTTLEDLAQEDHEPTRVANDVEHHLKLVQKSPPAPFMGVRPHPRSPTTLAVQYTITTSRSQRFLKVAFQTNDSRTGELWSEEVHDGNNESQEHTQEPDKVIGPGQESPVELPRAAPEVANTRPVPSLPCPDKGEGVVQCGLCFRSSKNF